MKTTKTNTYVKAMAQTPVQVKVIQNQSLQGLNVPFMTPEGLKDIFLGPKSTVTVPISWDSKILNTFISRRLVKVTISE